MARLPHLGPPAGLGHGVEQRLARLHIGDDARARPLGQQVAREQDEQLVCPEHVPFAVHRAQPVAVAVERNAEVKALAAHQIDKLDQVFRHGRVRMVGRECPVDFLVQQEMFARQLRREPGHDAPGRTVAGVPADAESRPVARLLGEARDIGVLHRRLRDRALPGRKIAGGRKRPQRPDMRAEKGLALQHHLEAVIVGRVVRSRHHDAAIQPQVIHREIEHRRRPEADAGDRDAGGGKPLDQRRFQTRRAQPAVTADRRAAPPAPHENGPESKTERQRIRFRQGLSDNAARIVFPEEARVENMPGHGARPLPTPR